MQLHNLSNRNLSMTPFLMRFGTDTYGNLIKHQLRHGGIIVSNDDDIIKLLGDRDFFARNLEVLQPNHLLFQYCIEEFKMIMPMQNWQFKQLSRAYNAIHSNYKRTGSIP